MKFPALPELVYQRENRVKTDPKTCNTCLIEKTFSDFPFGNYTDGFAKKCRSCSKAEYIAKKTLLFSGVPEVQPVVLPDINILITIAQQLITFIQNYK